MTKKILQFIGISGAMLLSSCGSATGSSGSSTEDANNVVASEPVIQGGENGIFSIKMYEETLSNKFNVANNYTNPPESSSRVSGIFSLGTGLSLLANFMPEEYLMSWSVEQLAKQTEKGETNRKFREIAGQIDQINNSLDFQETQIQDLYSKVDAVSKRFAAVVKYQAFEKLSAAYGHWYENNFAPGLFYGYGANTAEIHGLDRSVVANPWYQKYMNIITPTKLLNIQPDKPSESIVQRLQEIAKNKDSMLLLLGITNQSNAYFSNEISNASLSSMMESGNKILLQAVGVGIASSVSDNLTINLYNAAQEALISELPTIGEKGADFIQLVDVYNSYIAGIMRMNIATLQATYTLEMTINYLNYMNYLNHLNSKSLLTPLTQICGLEPNSVVASPFNIINFYAGGKPCNNQNLATTLYYPNGFEAGNGQALSLNNAESALAYAQNKLTDLYTRRINILYEQSMKYIYSDQAFLSQDTNYDPKTGVLSPYMESIIHGTHSVKSLSIAKVNQMPAGKWATMGNLYQYGIVNLDLAIPNVIAAINQQLLDPSSSSYPLMPAYSPKVYPLVYPNEGALMGYYDGKSFAIFNNNLNESTPRLDLTTCITNTKALVHKINTGTPGGLFDPTGISYSIQLNRLICNLSASAVELFERDDIFNSNKGLASAYQRQHDEKKEYNVDEMSALKTENKPTSYSILFGVKPNKTKYSYEVDAGIVNNSAFNLIASNKLNPESSVSYGNKFTADLVQKSYTVSLVNVNLANGAIIPFEISTSRNVGRDINAGSWMEPFIVELTCPDIKLKLYQDGGYSLLPSNTNLTDFNDFSGTPSTTVQGLGYCMPFENGYRNTGFGPVGGYSSEINDYEHFGYVTLTPAIAIGTSDGNQYAIVASSNNQHTVYINVYNLSDYIKATNNPWYFDSNANTRFSYDFKAGANPFSLKYEYTGLPTRWFTVNNQVKQ